MDNFYRDLGFPVANNQLNQIYHNFAEMKFLENSKLEALSEALSTDQLDCKLDVRIESYSCKMVQSDKRLFKEMLTADGPGTSPHDLQPLSPPVANDQWTFAGGHSPGGSRIRNVSGSDEYESDSGPKLCDSISRKLLFDLVTLMNTSFPDYDFTGAKGDNFTKILILQTVTRAVDTQLSAVMDSYKRIKQHMWSIIDEEIHLKDTCIYSYNPDYASDIFSEDGCIWSFNYFFYNKRLKRILFFACRALSAQAVSEESGETMNEPMWNIDA